MNLFLSEDVHAARGPKSAGWHRPGGAVPAKLTPVHLSPYRPELNPVERVWLYLA